MIELEIVRWYQKWDVYKRQYCGSIPYLAEFERQLDSEGRFEEFKEKFEEIAGAPWEKKRQAFAVIQDKIVKTIVAMDFMSEEAARNWCKSAKSGYDLSIETVSYTHLSQGRQGCDHCKSRQEKAEMQGYG